MESISRSDGIRHSVMSLGGYSFKKFLFEELKFIEYGWAQSSRNGGSWRFVVRGSRVMNRGLPQTFPINRPNHGLFGW